MTEVTREQWMAVCQIGDEHAFAPFFESSKALVWTICRCILRNEADALDATQSTYARLLELARRPDDPEALRPPVELVGLMARRESMALLKRNQRQRRRETSMNILPETLAPAATPREEAARREEREKIHVLISALPDPYRLPVLMHYIHGMTQEQVAGILERPRGTISVQIRRGLRLLEPLMRQAGLGSASVALGLLAGSAALLSPHSALAAGDVFLKAHVLMAASSFAVGSTTTALTGKWFAGVTLMKAKMIALVMATLLLGTVGMSYLRGPAKSNPARASAESHLVPIANSSVTSNAAAVSKEKLLGALLSQRSQIDSIHVAFTAHYDYSDPSPEIPGLPGDPKRYKIEDYKADFLQSGVKRLAIISTGFNPQDPHYAPGQKMNTVTSAFNGRVTWSISDQTKAGYTCKGPDFSTANRMLTAFLDPTGYTNVYPESERPKDVNLIELLKSSEVTVSSQTEAMKGLQCYVVTKASDPRYPKMREWISPDNGYLVVHAEEYTYENHTIPSPTTGSKPSYSIVQYKRYAVDCSDIRSAGNGFFLPLKEVAREYGEGGKLEHVATFTVEKPSDIGINELIDQSIFDPQNIPSNYAILDKDSTSSNPSGINLLHEPQF